MPIPREHFPSDTVFTQLTCGDRTTFAETDIDELWGWRTFRVGLWSLPLISETKPTIFQSNDGILGFSKDVKIQSTPTKLPNLSSVKQIVCGANHAMALKQDGTVFIWGSGEQARSARPSRSRAQALRFPSPNSPPSEQKVQNHRLRHRPFLCR